MGTLIVRDAANACACGCLETVTQGRRFRPGHDQRLKGELIRAEIRGDQIEVVRQDSQGQPAKVRVMTPWQYGCSVLTKKGQAALYRGMNERTYHRASK